MWTWLRSFANSILGAAQCIQFALRDRGGAPHGNWSEWPHSGKMQASRNYRQEVVKLVSCGENRQRTISRQKWNPAL